MKPQVKLTSKQKAFKKICKENEVEVYDTYSGRGMFGRTCPAVNLDYPAEFPGNPHKYSMDNMGLGVVVYCP